MKTFHSSLSIASLVMCAAVNQIQADPFEQVLTSTEQNLLLDRYELLPEQLDFPTREGWSVRKYTLHGGKQEGVDVIVVDNGQLSARICPTRGMGILEVRMGEIRLGWDSPVKEIVHPRHIHLQSRGGLGWLEGFNEWMVRCGLEWAGHPGTDTFINNVGAEAEMELTLHGKIANIPASEVIVSVDREPPHRIRIRGRVEERMFYGPKLELWTEFSTEPGSSAFRLEDRLTNRGGHEQEFQVIYHANYGMPLLEEGARFHGAIRRVAPLNEHAAQGMEHFEEYGAPQKGYIEKVYCLWPLGDEKGWTSLVLRNRAGDKGVAMSFPVTQLPYVTLWKNLADPREGYVTGLEPGTGFPYNRSVEREFERVPTLSPGQTRTFRIDFEILENEEAVEQGKERVRSIQGGHSLHREMTPANQLEE